MVVPGHTCAGPEMVPGRSGTLATIPWQRLLLVSPQLLVLVKHTRPPPLAVMVIELVPCPLTMFILLEGCQLKVAPAMGSTLKVVVPTFGHKAV